MCDDQASVGLDGDRFKNQSDADKSCGLNLLWNDYFRLVNGVWQELLSLTESLVVVIWRYVHQVTSVGIYWNVG